MPMSRLDTLIAELCPGGVEFVPLGEVIDYEQPTKYIVKNTNYDDEHKTPVLTAGQSFVLGYTKEEDGVYHASKDNPVIIFDDFTTSFHWVDFHFKVKSSAMKLLTNKNENLTLFKYVYYAMRCIGFEPDKADHKRHWIGVYSGFQIPVPPLPIQHEIARILDYFTELTAALTTELSVRQKQYDYYRGKLLTFENANGRKV